MKKCKISVVMSTYNESETDLTKAIDSILNQTFEDFEFIIILDNPNNELHKEILKKYQKKDSRVKFFSNQLNIGLAASLNRAIDLSHTDIIARMDADDISLPNRLEKEYSIITSKDIDIVSTNKIEIDENDNVINISNSLPNNDDKIKKMLKYMSVIVHPSVMFKKTKILEIGKYRDFPASQDYDLWLRAINNHLKFYIINEPLIKYRIRNDSISKKNSLKQWCIHEYIYKLYIKRNKNGYDNFNKDNLESYLLKNGVFNEKSVRRFNDGMVKIDESKRLFKNQKIIKAAITAFISIFYNKKIIKVIYSYFACIRIKRSN